MKIRVFPLVSAAAVLFCSTAVAQPPTFTKSFNPATVPINGTSTLQFLLGNPSATTSLTDVAFTDNLPSGVVVTTPGVASGVCATGSLSTTVNRIVLSGGTLSPSSTCTISISVTATLPGALFNYAEPVASSGGLGPRATATLTVGGTPPAPPSIAKSFTPSHVQPGGTTTLSFQIANSSSSSASGVGFTDSLPSGVTVAVPNGLSGSCGGGTITAVAGSGSVSLSGATLAGGASCTFSVSVVASTGGVLTNTTSALSSSLGSGSPATAVLDVSAPPTLSKSFGVVAMLPGETTSLTFTLTNPNSSLNLTGLAFSDTLPAGLVVGTPNGLTGSCNGGTITAPGGGNTIALTGATLSAGASCTFSVQVTTSPGLGLIEQGLLTNTTSTVTSNEAAPGAPAQATIFIGDAFQISYAANLTSGDSYVEMTNSGANGASAQSGMTANVPGSFCANVYVFAPDEEMVECCSCPVTPDGLAALSAQQSLISNTLTVSTPNSIVIKLVATVPVGGSCANSAAALNTSTLSPGLAAWSTTLHNPTGYSYQTTEKPFTPSDLSAGELGRLATTCSFIQAQGSGFGLCGSCSFTEPVVTPESQRATASARP